MIILEQGNVVVLDKLSPIQTTLGTCVSVCARDPKLEICGMNHFALPFPLGGDVSVPQRYGIYAMEILLASLYEKGATKDSLEVSYVGGANVNEGMIKIGWMNIGFIEDFLGACGITVKQRCVGGVMARKLVYFPQSGKLDIDFIGRCPNSIYQSVRSDGFGGVF